MMSCFLWLLQYMCLLCARSLVLAIKDSGSLQRRSNAAVTATTEPLWDNIQSTVSQHTRVTQNPQNNPEWPLYITSGPEEDYYYDDEDPKVIPPSLKPVSQCSYDRCAHLSLTCEEIQSKTSGSCSCPGIDGPSSKPDPPNLRQVMPGERVMSVNWCSPLSTVNSYRVLHQGSDGQLEVGPILNASYRSYSIGNLVPGTRYTVCVVAINDAGESPVEINEVAEDTEENMSGQCRILYTNGSKNSHIYIGLGLGALAVVLLILGFLLWNRQRRKARMGAEEEEMGIPDQTYKVWSVSQQ